MKLPILTEAQILGVKHPIVKGTARILHHEKPYGFTSSDILYLQLTDISIYRFTALITPSPDPSHDKSRIISDKDGACVVVCKEKEKKTNFMYNINKSNYASEI